MLAFVRRLNFSPLQAGAILTIALAAAFWMFVSPTVSGEEVVSEEVAPLEVVPPVEVEPEPIHEYIEVMDSCGPHYEGESGCVQTRSGPGLEYAPALKLRTGVVLQVSEAFQDGMRLWYKVIFDEPLRYPERVARSQYVSSDNVRHFYADGVKMLAMGEHASTTKHIIVDRSEQKLYAYDGDELVQKLTISTGLQLTPTPRGLFTIYKKTPTRYMQGPLPGVSDQYYDLPGVPWNLYFSNQGAVIHGAYWHNSFGRPWSHGCVNVSLADAKVLYEWADIGTRVLVRD